MDKNNYEQVPYPNFVFSDTHPARLASTALLFGIDAKASDNSRVLEIGCGSGINSLAHAAYLTKSNFTAIDASVRQIENANQILAAVKFKNIIFQNCKIENFTADSESFDYIICHGVFSWVPKNTQHQILMACQKLLSKNGVAYISYNCLPGWHIQNIIREFLIFDQYNNSSDSNTARARQILNFAAANFEGNFKSLIKSDLEHLSKVDDAYLTHEYLAHENHAYYFKDFTELLEQHGLKYLAESDLGSMLPREYEPHIQDQLMEFAGNRQLTLEQYCDFLRLRRFRKSLIVKTGFSRELKNQNIKEMYVSARKSNSSGNYQPKSSLNTEKFSLLAKSFPKYIKVSELISSSKVNISEIVEAVMLDDLELRDKVNQNYSVSELVGYLAKFGNQLPNYRSENIRVSDELRKVLADKQKLTSNILQEAIRLGLLSQ